MLQHSDMRYVAEWILSTFDPSITTEQAQLRGTCAATSNLVAKMCGSVLIALHASRLDVVEAGKSIHGQERQRDIKENRSRRNISSADWGIDLDDDGQQPLDVPPFPFPCQPRSARTLMRALDPSCTPDANPAVELLYKKIGDLFLWKM